MNGFPKIHVVGGRKIETGKRYKLFIGRKGEEIVCLALSDLANDDFTVAKLLMEVDAVFCATTCLVDVFVPKGFSFVMAKFWSPTYTYAYKEESLDTFLNDTTEERWNNALGEEVAVSFYPFGGPAGLDYRNL